MMNTPKNGGVILAIFLLLLLCISPVVGYKIEISALTPTGAHDFVVDSNGIAHICYIEDGNDDVMYAQYNTRTGDVLFSDSKVFDVVNDKCSIGIDSSNRPYIASKDTNFDLKICYNATTTWDCDVAEAGTIQEVDLVVINDAAWVVWSDTGLHVARAGRYVSSAWGVISTAIDPASTNDCNYISIAENTTTNEPSVVCRTTGNAIDFSYYDGSWHYSTTGLTSVNGGATGLLYVDDEPYIQYYSGSTDTMTHLAYKDAGVWVADEGMLYQGVGNRQGFAYYDDFYSLEVKNNRLYLVTGNIDSWAYVDYGSTFGATNTLEQSLRVTSDGVMFLWRNLTDSDLWFYQSFDVDLGTVNIYCRDEFGNYISCDSVALYNEDLGGWTNTTTTSIPYSTTLPQYDYTVYIDKDGYTPTSQYFTVFEGTTNVYITLYQTAYSKFKIYCRDITTGNYISCDLNILDESNGVWYNETSVYTPFEYDVVQGHTYNITASKTGYYDEIAVQTAWATDISIILYLKPSLCAAPSGYACLYIRTFFHDCSDLTLKDASGVSVTVRNQYSNWSQTKTSVGGAVEFYVPENGNYTYTGSKSGYISYQDFTIVTTGYATGAIVIGPDWCVVTYTPITTTTTTVPPTIPPSGAAGGIVDLWARYMGVPAWMVLAMLALIISMICAGLLAYVAGYGGGTGAGMAAAIGFVGAFICCSIAWRELIIFDIVIIIGGVAIIVFMGRGGGGG